MYRPSPSSRGRGLGLGPSSRTNGATAFGAPGGRSVFMTKSREPAFRPFSGTRGGSIRGGSIRGGRGRGHGPGHRGGPGTRGGPGQSTPASLVWPSSGSSGRGWCGGCPRRGCRLVYPYIIRPLRNFDKVFPIFTITYLDGVTTRRAWLNLPEADGEVATVHLLTYREELGCCDALFPITLETSMVQAGSAIPQSTPVTFEVFNPAVGSFYMGCAEGDGGRVVFTTTPCYTTAPTDSWWNIAAQYWTTDQPYVRTGTPLVADTISTGRVLRALATPDPNVFELAFCNCADNIGYDTAFVLASPDTCPPCGGSITDASFAPGPCEV